MGSQLVVHDRVSLSNPRRGYLISSSSWLCLVVRLSRILNWPQANWCRRAIPEYAGRSLSHSHSLTHSLSLSLLLFDGVVSSLHH